MSFSKLRLINADLRKCADSSYTKSVLRVVAERDFAAVAVGNTGRAAVYETSDVFLFLLFLFFFNRLNINLLKELRQKQWFQTLIKKKRRFHPSDANKAVSCSYCEAGESLWPFCVSRDLP